MDESGYDWVAVFTDVFAGSVSAVQQRIFAEALGDEYPAEVQPYSFTSRSELARIAAEVHVGPGDLLLDVGGGRGGPGLWVAAQTGAGYVDVDIAPSALAEVLVRAERLGMADRVEARVGSFAQLPLDDGSADAIMSIDALLFAPDKPAAVGELARVLRPGGRLVLTTWDYHTQPAGRPPQVDDHRPLLEAAGLRVLAYDETPDWLGRQRRIHDLTRASIDELAAESGMDVEVVRADVDETASTVDTMIRRVLMIAER